MAMWELARSPRQIWTFATVRCRTARRSCATMQPMRVSPLIVCAVVLLAARHAPRPSESVTVSRAIDGDTLQLSDGRKVRLIGVDTPELHHPKKPVQAFAEAARQFTHDAVGGKHVRLEFDKAKPSDKYGRLLAYVYREPDGWCLNRELIAAGFAHVETRWPFPQLDAFRALEREARDQRRGLWADDQTQ